LVEREVEEVEQKEIAELEVEREVEREVEQKEIAELEVEREEVEREEVEEVAEREVVRAFGNHMFVRR